MCAVAAGCDVIDVEDNPGEKLDWPGGRCRGGFRFIFYFFYFAPVFREGGVGRDGTKRNETERKGAWGQRGVGRAGVRHEPVCFYWESKCCCTVTGSVTPTSAQTTPTAARLLHTQRSGLSRVFYFVPNSQLSSAICCSERGTERGTVYRCVVPDRCS